MKEQYRNESSAGERSSMKHQYSLRIEIVSNENKGCSVLAGNRVLFVIFTISGFVIYRRTGQQQ